MCNTLEATLPRVLMADDHHLLLDALQSMMKDQFNILAVDNSEAFINAVGEFRPDLAVLDISMPGANGFATARKALERHPSLPIVFLSMYADSSYVDQAAQVGARAYLSKCMPVHELISALQSVLEGGTLLVSESKPGAAPQSESEKGELTARQREVLRLIALGCSAKDIANRLNISVRTAEFHRAAIMQRLGLHSTAQMTRYALANDLG